jgi:hypothetical protein
MKDTARAMAQFYKVCVKSADYHVDGNWYCNLKEFPGAYFDANGCVIFQTENDYFGCAYLTIGPKNTSVRSKNTGMGIADIPGYQKLNPPPSSLWISG